MLSVKKRNQRPFPDTLAENAHSNDTAQLSICMTDSQVPFQCRMSGAVNNKVAHKQIISDSCVMNRIMIGEGNPAF